MTSRSDDAARVAAGVLALGLLAAGPAAAQEWHEAYRSGVTALGRGDAARAAESLRRAVALRPQPGRNVVTYGTNVEPRYFPYLRLAEAYLALGQFEPARQTLETSAKWGIEPAEERQKLVARIDAWVEQQQRSHAPPSTAAPQPATPPPTPPPSPSVSPPETPAPATPSPAPAAGTPVKAIPSPASRSPQAPASPEAKAHGTGPDGVHPPPVPPPAETVTGALELFSQPAGAAAYLDDEPIGSTDPETGRLLKTGLSARRHRVRVAREGHDDVVRDIEVSGGRTAAFYATLKPRSDPQAGDRGPLLALGAVVIVVVAALAWMVLRRPEESPGSIGSSTPRSPRTASLVLTPSGPPTPGARRDELGQEWFGDYRLLELLGRGGMASVYKAERRGELSALKRPLASFLDDPQFMERFLREAEIGRTLNHPSIARILERGEVERVPYFTMELLAGQTLEAQIGGWGAAEPRTAASIVVQVAEALDFAHSKGVVHRDLKPSNIMMLPDGTAKVMDFGIARARRFDGLTATGAFLGTPDYVAPEMIEGRGTEPRSDLYAVGVILFELLTGERPFSGETAFEIFKKHCSEEPPPPSRTKRGVPAELDALVLRLLEKDPALRPASAEDVVVTLRDWLNRAA